MMRQKGTKIWNIFPAQNSKQLLFLFLCLFFCFSLSAQIYIEKNTSFFLSDSTCVTQSAPLLIQEKNKASVYIIEETIVSNIQETELIKITYIPSNYSIKTKNNFAKKKRNRRKKLKEIIIEEDEQKNLSFSKTNIENKNFLHSLQKLILTIIISSKEDNSIQINKKQQFLYQQTTFADKHKQINLYDRILFSFDYHLYLIPIRAPPDII